LGTLPNGAEAIFPRARTGRGRVIFSPSGPDADWATAEGHAGGGFNSRGRTMAKKTATKPATRKQLIEWLARCARHLPPNLCQISPFQMPPQWAKDMLAELRRNGIEFKPPIFNED
jgi:hypothetical protein